MSKRSKEISAEISGNKVRIVYRTENRIVWATRDQTGRIRYDHPERVPRHLKQRIVPELFKEIDRKQFGIR